MSRLRPFQQNAKAAIFQHWQEGHKNVLLKSPTGSGKTVIFADIVRTVDRAAAVIAHRSELVSQTSLALAREGVRHRIVGQKPLCDRCTTLHMEQFGRNWVESGARVGVCSVDTLKNKDISQDSWYRQVGLWVQDEAHHLLKDNKWGQSIEMFPNAYGLGVTATPARADGKGLGTHSDGLFDSLVQGPEMRDLIDSGYLTEYRIFAPPSDVDYSEVKVTASGDLSPAKLRAAVHASDKIVGDVVTHYLRIAKGKLGVTFAVDVESAKEIAQAFREAGVPAEVVTAKTPDVLRAHVLRRFKNREILQLVNCDLFGEGFDLPAIEVVSFVRKTESWPLFVQQFGRALRLMVSDELNAIWGTLTDEQRLAHIAASGKPVALIIDHVGNVIRHGLPDAPRIDSLDRRSARNSGPSDAIPLRACPNPNADGMGTPCASIYERFHKCCPYCGFYPEPAARSAPEYVDGDLYELDAETLAAMRGKVAQIDGAPRIPQHLDPIASRAVMNAHHARATAQGVLRQSIALWAGWQKHQGYDDSQSYRRFYHTFGIDVLSAQALGRPDAEALTLRIQTILDQHGVIEA